MKEKFKEALSSIKEVMKTEFRDNKMALKILMKKRKTCMEKKKLKEQMIENVKMLFLFILMILPGSALLIGLAIKLAKKMKVELFPRKTFD